MTGQGPLEVGRPAMPAGYGLAAAGVGQLDWSWVEDRLGAARSYWLCTTRADGRPHAMPVWGLWLDGAAWFSTDPSSVKGRNLTRAPEVVVHLESGDDCVVVEGRARRVDDATALTAFCDRYEAKYAIRPQPQEPSQAVYRVAPVTVLAWREADFPTSATRWRLADAVS